jgi:hypothetical protein
VGSEKAGVRSAVAGGVRSRGVGLAALPWFTAGDEDGVGLELHARLEASRG